MIDLLIESPILLLVVVAALGYLLGQIRIKGSSLGVSAVLFAGLGVGAMHPAIELPEFTIVLGLVLFVYTIGLSSGPGFFASFRRKGVRDNLLAVGVLLYPVVLLMLRNARLVEIATYFALICMLFVTVISRGNLQITSLVAATAFISGAFIVSRPIYIVTNVVIFSSLVFGGLEVVSNSSQRLDALTSITVVFALLLVISVTARFFSNRLQTTFDRSRRNTELLRATAEVGQIATKILNQDELFRRAVELIRDRFVYYHVQIFLVDENRHFADLVASTGEAGQQLLARQHRLAVGSQSVIGRVTQTGEPVVAKVHGYAIGAGAELALSADFVLAADDAEFRFRDVPGRVAADADLCGAMWDELPAASGRCITLWHGLYVLYFL